MTYKEFNTLFKKKTTFLSYEESLNLALTIINLLYPDYEDFVNSENWGDKNLLLDAIELCKQAKYNIRNEAKINETLLKLESILPDSEEFGSSLSTYALNSGLAVYYTLRFIIDNDKIHIYNVGNYYIETIDIKILENENLSEEQIDKHPKMVDAYRLLLEKI